jgi:hypothetical protein
VVNGLTIGATAAAYSTGSYPTARAILRDCRDNGSLAVKDGVGVFEVVNGIVVN